MMVPPLPEHPVTQEDEERFRSECAPRRYTLWRGWADYRAEATARRPTGIHARAQAWLHVEPFYWTMRVVYVCLTAGAVFAVYINGVAEGWWHAWGEKPSVAATLIHPDGAGLRKRPTRTSYTNKYIPTLVSVTNPTQTHTVTLFVREVTVTFKATNYEWDWGDDTPNTTTAYQGIAFEKSTDPNTDPALIHHYYTPPNRWRSRFDGPYPNATRTITLTTTWAGTATNPFTGETQTINGLVTTTETTGPFPLNHLIVSNTDTWEEKQGH